MDLMIFVLIFVCLFQTVSCKRKSTRTHMPTKAEVLLKVERMRCMNLFNYFPEV